MNHLLRNSRKASYMLLVLRLYLGYLWLTAGLSKVFMEGGFHAEGLITGAINQGSPEQPFAYPWFQSFLKLMTDNGQDAALFNLMVPWGEVFVGLGLIFGTFTLAAAFFGLVMNFTYLLSGMVSVNPTFIIIEFIILTAGFNAGKIGLDYWVTPYLRRKFPFIHKESAE
ncbi:DoxX family protein [Weissella ceti]|uniref:DoxX family protein n=1 Tax=Weissella ceti TaxID=759620 RepID=A0ABT3E486_9LACO|nr:DoxX family protein [Weissella ceti]MCW0953234.1 DoxX family protein [Weissella ceti]QVK12750.1 DoxX family protein [Weissella ceti]